MRSYYYRPPKIYAQTQERRRQDALAAAQRQACTSQKVIAETVAERGEQMSDEGRGFLQGMAEALGRIGGMLGGRGR